LNQLDDLLTLGMDTVATCTAWVNRDKRLLRCHLTWPAAKKDVVTLSWPALPSDTTHGAPQARWPAATA